MWDYRVVTGSYGIDGNNVILKNPAGEGTLQGVLDHYGNERWELVSTSFDNVHREVVLVFKRPKGGVAAAPPPAPMAFAAPPPVVHHAAPPAMAAPPAAVFVDPELGAIKRRAPAGQPSSQGGGGRRSKADLDRLAREE